MKSCNKEE